MQIEKQNLSETKIVMKEKILSMKKHSFCGSQLIRKLNKDFLNQYGYPRNIMRFSAGYYVLFYKWPWSMGTLICFPDNRDEIKVIYQSPHLTNYTLSEDEDIIFLCESDFIHYFNKDEDMAYNSAHNKIKKYKVADGTEEIILDNNSDVKFCPFFVSSSKNYIYIYDIVKSTVLFFDLEKNRVVDTVMTKNIIQRTVQIGKDATYFSTMSGFGEYSIDVSDKYDSIYVMEEDKKFKCLWRHMNIVAGSAIEDICLLTDGILVACGIDLLKISFDGNVVFRVPVRLIYPELKGNIKIASICIENADSSFFSVILLDRANYDMHIYQHHIDCRDFINNKR